MIWLLGLMLGSGGGDIPALALMFSDGNALQFSDGSYLEFSA